MANWEFWIMNGWEGDKTINGSDENFISMTQKRSRQNQYHQPWGMVKNDRQARPQPF